jgi:hypothetical protein
MTTAEIWWVAWALALIAILVSSAAPDAVLLTRALRRLLARGDQS